MTLPTRLIPILAAATLGVAAAPPAQAADAFDASAVVQVGDRHWHRGHHGGWGPPGHYHRHWGLPTYYAPPPRVYYPPPRVYYAPPPVYYAPPPVYYVPPPRYYAPQPSVGLYFRF
jgi:hypothetical protein